MTSFDRFVQAATDRLDARKKEKGARRAASTGMHSVSMDFDYSSNTRVAACATCGLRWSGPGAYNDAANHLRDTSEILSEPQQQQETSKHAEPLGQWGDPERYWPE